MTWLSEGEFAMQYEVCFLLISFQTLGDIFSPSRYSRLFNDRDECIDFFVKFLDESKFFFVSSAGSYV